MSWNQSHHKLINSSNLEVHNCNLKLTAHIDIRNGENIDENKFLNVLSLDYLSPTTLSTTRTNEETYLLFYVRITSF